MGGREGGREGGRDFGSTNLGVTNFGPLQSLDFQR